VAFSVPAAAAAAAAAAIDTVAVGICVGTRLQQRQRKLCETMEACKI
jgi:hypothetical protein